MGKSAFPMVVAMQEPVVPRALKAGAIKQPPYSRSKRTLSTSARLAKFRGCIATDLAGKHPGSQAKVREDFTAAAKRCKGAA